VTTSLPPGYDETLLSSHGLEQLVVPLSLLLVMSPVGAMPTVPLTSSKKSKKLRYKVHPMIDEPLMFRRSDEPAMTSRIDYRVPGV
jgi:hypothetical protein